MEYVAYPRIALGVFNVLVLAAALALAIAFGRASGPPRGVLEVVWVPLIPLLVVALYVWRRPDPTYHWIGTMATFAAILSVQVALSSSRVGLIGFWAAALAAAIWLAIRCASPTRLSVGETLGVCSPLGTVQIPWSDVARLYPIQKSDRVLVLRPGVTLRWERSDLTQRLMRLHNRATVGAEFVWNTKRFEGGPPTLERALESHGVFVEAYPGAARADGRILASGGPSSPGQSPPRTDAR